MKIAIVGSREYSDMKFAKHQIYHIFTKQQELRSDVPILVSGGARGIDKLSEEVIDEINRYMAYAYKIEKEIIYPDWDKYGKRAGFLRNEIIVKHSDRVIAFWDGKSKGTKNTIDIAIKLGKPIDIYIRH